MTIQLTMLTNRGIVMAADRRLTDSSSGKVLAENAQKLIPIPALRAAVGYAGLAQAASFSLVRWLRKHSARAGASKSLRDYADRLNADVAKELRERHLDRYPVQIHLAGYGSRNRPARQEFWYIRNTQWFDSKGRIRVLRRFSVSLEASRALPFRPQKWFVRLFFSGERGAYAKNLPRLRERVPDTGFESLARAGGWAAKDIAALYRDLLRRSRVPSIGDRRSAFLISEKESRWLRVVRPTRKRR